MLPLCLQVSPARGTPSTPSPKPTQQGRAPISHCRAQLVSEIRARVPGALTHITAESLHLASCWHCSIDNSIPHYPGGLPGPRGC